MSNTKLAAAIAGAVPEAEEELSTSSSEEEAQGTAEAEASATRTKEAPASPEVGSEVDASSLAPERIEAFEQAWKLDLSALPDDESREKFITEFEESNKTIGKLQREKAEAQREAEEARLAAQAPVSEPEVDVSSLTDEQIASAIGIDLESSMDPERDMREVQLTRTLLEQQERLERMEKGYQSSAMATQWESKLSELEGKYGALPSDTTHEDVLAYAQENGIASAEAAYWAAVGPVRASLTQALEKKVSDLRTSGKKGATTVRPKGSAAVDEAKLASTNVKDAIKEAFEKARASLGASNE